MYKHRTNKLTGKILSIFSVLSLCLFYVSIPVSARITTTTTLTGITAAYDGETENITLDSGSFFDLTKLEVIATYTVTTLDTETGDKETKEETKTLTENQYTLSSNTVLKGTRTYTVSYEYRAKKKTATFSVTGTGTIDEEEFFYDSSADGWYMISKSGSLIKNSWKKVENRWFLFDEDGYLLTGWQYRGGRWYYLDKSNYSMVTGWFSDPEDDILYYMNEDGSMKAGEWLFYNNRWYYFNSTGLLTSGWIQDKNTWYFIQDDHTLLTGWKLWRDDWYYLETSGAMVTGWREVNGKWYYFAPNGMMTVNTFIDGYYVNGDGVWIPGY